MDLSTSYLGMKLRNPLVPSASPLSDEISGIRRMEDAGAAAVVLYSIFEEEIRLERYELEHHLTHGTESYPESLTYFPEPESFQLGPERYLDHVRKAKEAVGIPVLASINGSSLGAWTEYSTQIEQAGADALELNIYSIPSDLDVPGARIEDSYLDILRAVKSAVSIPVAVKLSPFFSNTAHMAKRLARAGADGLVLFNRFYQPDVDLENLEVKPNLILSTAQALRLPLTWIGILHGRLDVGLAATSGIHRAEDVLKVVMAGADVAMLCSVLLKRGIGFISEIQRSLVEWMEEHEYESIQQMKGSLSQIHCADPSAFERSQYMQTITNYWSM